MQVMVHVTWAKTGIKLATKHAIRQKFSLEKEDIY